MQGTGTASGMRAGGCAHAGVLICWLAATPSARRTVCCTPCGTLPGSICFEELDLGRKEYEGLSDDARAFIQALLVKDPLKVGLGGEVGMTAAGRGHLRRCCSWQLSGSHSCTLNLAARA